MRYRAQAGMAEQLGLHYSFDRCDDYGAWR